MTAQSIVCGACAAEVPYGRLSCPSCGELLASVAGSRRAPAPTTAPRAAVPDVLYEPPAAPTRSLVDGEVSLGTSARDPETELPWADSTPTQAAAGGVAASVGNGAGPAGGLLDDDAPGLPSWTPSSSTVPWGNAADLNGGRTPAYMPRPGIRPPAAQPAVQPDALTEPDHWPTPDVAPVDDPRPEPVWPANALAVATAAAAAATARPPAAIDLPASAAPMPLAATPTIAPGPISQPAQAFAGPGAYVPPLPVAVAAGPPGPAREWAGHAEAPAIDGATSPDAAPRVETDTRKGLLDFTRWLSVAGAAFAAVGFLLPWGQVVIGSPDTDYFGRWGIAGPWHLVVALAILGILGLALIDNMVPIWLRTGIAGLGLGALLLGLVWPYLTLPVLGMGPGALIAAIGAAALVASGILALVTDRHGEPARTV